MKITRAIVFGLGLSATTSALAATVLNGASLSAMKGKYTYELLEDPSFSALVSASVSKELIDNTSTSTPAEFVDGRFLVAGGCEPHNCGDNRALIAIDSKNPKAVLVIRKQKNEFTKNEDNIVVIPNAAWAKSLSGNELRFPGLRKAIDDL